MKLVHSDWGIELNLIENYVNVLVIEHPAMLRDCIGSFVNQVKEEEGPWVLTDGIKPIAFSKNIDLLLEPFTLELNNHKIQSKLYQMIKGYSDEMLTNTISELNCQIISFLDEALICLPISICYDLDFDLQGLLKLYHVSVNTIENNYLENFIDYLRICSQLLNRYTLVFLNLKSYFDENELKEIYNFAFYSKINLVLIESNLRSRLDCEKMTIIDLDRCTISV